MAAAVVAVAGAMACLPAVISIIWRGDQTPAATGLGLLGFSLLCLKIVSFLYAVGAVTAPARRVAESVEPEPSQPVERTTARPGFGQLYDAREREGEPDQRRERGDEEHPLSDQDPQRDRSDDERRKQQH